MKTFRILALGDVVARPGRLCLSQGLPAMRAKYAPDCVIVNGENAAGGSGIDRKTADEIFAAGACVITLGDHVWRRSEVKALLEKEASRMCRPANFPGQHPGVGSLVIEQEGLSIGVMNVLGRVFTGMLLDCPFQVAEQLLQNQLAKCDLIFCDMHAEATSEKLAFARVFDGRIHGVFGTHTHVPTADLQTLPLGSAFVSDLGMCGSSAGVIGMAAETAISRFLTGANVPYKAAEGQEWIRGVFVEFDMPSKKCLRFERIDEAVPIHAK
jgi:metallophosphoesterase (TIGR00282 family)